jgi:MerR family transcriptional regulator, thiopeptide resistance regulator
MKDFLKIGDLAAKTGLSVRTLHYYEEIGLLSPSYRTEAGHRLYTPEDIAQLQRIVALKSLGFPLEEIKGALEKPEFSPQKIVEMQIEQVSETLTSHAELLERLKGVQRYFETYPDATTDDLLTLIALTARMDESLTDEQRAGIAERGRQLGEAGMRTAEGEWKALIDAVKTEMQKGTDPLSPRMQELARQWQGLVNAFTGGDPEIAATLKKQYEENPGARAAVGMDPQMMEYVRRAMDSI